MQCALRRSAIQRRTVTRMVVVFVRRRLNGSYEALESGSSTEAMQDFTGGVTETFNIEQEVPKDLFKIMRKAFERDSLLGCSVSTKVNHHADYSYMRMYLLSMCAY